MRGGGGVRLLGPEGQNMGVFFLNEPSLMSLYFFVVMSLCISK